LQEKLNQEYWAWSKKKGLVHDLLSMIGTLGFCVVGVISASTMGSLDRMFLAAMWAMIALSAASVISIILMEKVFCSYRDFVMAAM
jgi:hypothetical protein